VFAVLINSKATAGDLEGAQKAAKTSMILSIVAAGLGLIGWLMFFMLEDWPISLDGLKFHG
jgi:hypothetical protein